MSKRKRNRHRYMSENKEESKVVWTPGSTSSSGHTNFFKKCEHTGEVPILIGGIEIRLGGSPKITQAAIKASNLFISLNGQLPYMGFGQIIQFQYATLDDRGGVPANWKEFVESTINNMRNGFKILFWCHGSHGRTGTLGASLIALMEPEIEDPIAEIRARHCKEAVESLAQAKAIFQLKGLPLPDKYEEEFKKPVYGGYTGQSFGPVPGANGKDANGLYYHHMICKCSFCLDVKTKFKIGQPIPCECNSNDCLWDGMVRPDVGPFKHCVKCACGMCTNSRFKLVTYCQCPDTLCKSKAGGELDLYIKAKKLPSQSNPPQAEVLSIEDGKHEWYCLCKTCITEESTGYVCFNNPNCNCYNCVIADRKFELSLVTALNNEHGRTNHPGTCQCMQCLQDGVDLAKQDALDDAEDDMDTYRYCMEDADDGSECLGDTENPCKHIIAEDEALELAAARMTLHELHGDYCQCNECWAASGVLSIH